METSIPGLFAARDVRHNSTKRCTEAAGWTAVLIGPIRDRLMECLFQIAYDLRPVVNGGLSNGFETHCCVEGFGDEVWRIDIHLADNPIVSSVSRRGKEVVI